MPRWLYIISYPAHPRRIIVKYFPNACHEKYLKDNKDNSLYLALKYALIFVLGHYQFLGTHSFPRALLSEKRSLLGTDNVRGQISEHIFAANRDYCLYILTIYARPSSVLFFFLLFFQFFCLLASQLEKFFCIFHQRIFS